QATPKLGAFMYVVDGQDRVIELSELPAHDPGASEPTVLATGFRLLVAYRAVGDSDDRVVLEFAGVRAHYFGSPNDEALTGHPLPARGLTPYGSFALPDSSSPP